MKRVEALSEVDAEAPSFALHSLKGGSFELTFRGRFRLGWLGRLSSALSLRHVSVVNGRAERDQDGVWSGQLEIASTDHSSALPHLKWRELCEEPTTTALESMVLRSSLPGSGVSGPLLDLGITRVVVERRGKRALELSLQAKDQLGFLSALLARLGFLGLFPERIVVGTRGETVNDVILLSAIGGEISDSVEASLVSVLQRANTNSSSAPASRNRSVGSSQ